MDNTKKFAYIRVSTAEQNESRQLETLRKYVENDRDIFIDKATGKNFNRPSYQALKQQVRKGDTVYLHELDRLGRNKQEVLKELREFKDMGVTVRALNMPTTMVEIEGENSLIMEMVNNILIEVYTTLAEEERNKILKRQKEGIEAMPVNDEGKKVSIKTGRATGRPRAIKPDNFDVVADRVVRGEITSIQAMKELELTRNVYYRYLNEFKKERGL